MQYLRKILFLIIIVALGFISSDSYAADKSPYKNGDTIKIIVPFSPGGGYDVACRLIAPFFEKELEQITGVNLTVIIQNVTGAGGVKGYSRMFQSRPDGKTIGMVGLAAAPYQQIMTKLFDLELFSYIAIVNFDPDVVVVRKDNPINSFRELIDRSQSKPVLICTSGKGAGETVRALLTQAILEKHGIKFNIDFVHYEGSAPAFLGLIKGEVDVRMGTESQTYSHFRAGDVKGLVIFSKRKGKLFSSIPTLVEENIPGAEEMVDIMGQMRLLVAPPKLPDNIARVLRESMAKCLSNPEFLKMAESMDIPIDADTGEAAKNVAIKRITNAKKYQDIVKKEFE